MLGIQGSFAYNGNANALNHSLLSIRLNVPVFGYVSSDTSGQFVTRRTLDNDAVVFDQPVEHGAYSQDFDTQDLTGADLEAVRGFLGYTQQAYAQRSPELLRFAIPMTAADGNNLIATSSLQAMYFVQETRQVFRPRPTATSESASIISPLLMGATFSTIETPASVRIDGTDADEPRALHVPLFSTDVVLLNWETYQAVSAALGELPGFGTAQDYFELVALLAGSGYFALGQEELRTRLVTQILRRFTSDNRAIDFERLAELIEKHFPSMTDFPLVISAADPLVVSGTFTIDHGAVALIAADLALYDLSVAFGRTAIDGASRPQTLHLDWNADTVDLAGASATFAFPAAELGSQQSISGPVVVQAKSFDGATLWYNQYSVDDSALQELRIDVAKVSPVRIPAKGTGVAPAAGKRLRGQVVELPKTCPLENATVLIQAKRDGASGWSVVSSATADANGNFSAPYPFGRFTAARALVSLAPHHPVDIAIETGAGDEDTISGDFLYLLVTDAVCPPAKQDCGCDCEQTPSIRTPRLPSQTDLVLADEYTQDIGGSCVNLSTPNRTLSEYRYHAIVRTSDPDVVNYTLIKRVDDLDYALSYELASPPQPAQRASIGLSNPVLWQDAPDSGDNLTLYQSVSVATGHVLHYRSEFRADGYSLGDLIYSLALAPGQKKQVVVMDSSHSLRGSETQSIAQGERLAASLVNERAIADELGGNISEALRGNSSASTGGISAGLGAAVSYGGIFGASLGVAGGYASSSASASQNSSRDTSMFFGEKLRQAITQNAQSFRQLNATVVTSVSENQQYSVTTDVVANHNHCHALTMMYFEVLRHFAIYQELTSVEECLFIPLLMTEFTSANVSKWADVLTRHLLPIPSNTYLQGLPASVGRFRHPLVAAFDANERIRTNYQFVDYPIGAYCDEPITSVGGYLTIRLEIPRPQTIYDRLLSFPIVKREAIHDRNGGGLFGGIADFFVGSNNTSTTWEEKVKIVDDHILIYDNFQEARPADVIEVKTFKDFFRDGTQDGNRWKAFAKLCGYTDVEAFLANYFSHKTISQWDETFNKEIAPRIAEELLRGSISIKPLGAVDITPTAKYHGGSTLLRVNLQSSTSLTRRDISTVDVEFSKAIDFSADFWSGVTMNLETLSLNYTTSHYRGTLLDIFMGDDFEDDFQSRPAPMNRDEQRNPRDDDRYLARKLIEHLNSNVEHYNKALWANLDSDRRYMLLDGFSINVFNDFGIPNGQRSLASVVKNELLTVAGNSLVMPVAAGYKVSPAYIAEAGDNGEEEHISLFDHYRPYTPIPPYRISIPSPGVFVEAVQGACDACESVKENSSQDWTTFTTDEPTTVMPVQTPVPTVTDWKAAFKDFAPPLVNIQNAPGLPDPGLGLSDLAELLGKVGTFKDITGLDATQKNLLQTYLSNQENARAFAEMAKGLATQQHNTDHSSKIMDSIDKAQGSGALSDKERGQLVKDHLQQQIDGGESQRKRDAEAAKADETSTIDSAVDLAKAGSQVKATEIDSDGTTRTLEAGAPDPAFIKVGHESPGSQAPAPATDSFLSKSATLQFANSAELDTYFKSATGSDFPTWFREHVGGSGSWQGMNISKSATASQNLRSFMDAIPMIFESGHATLPEISTLLAILLNEVGSTLGVGAAEKGGSADHPGLAYFFESFTLHPASSPAFTKASYNVSPNRTAWVNFRDKVFTDAHGALEPMDPAIRALEEWKGKEHYPPVPEALKRITEQTAFIQQADFYKFRGRGPIQLTWRNAYEALAQTVQGYSGSNQIILDRKQRWSGMSASDAATASSNKDWDDLFTGTGMIIPAASIRAHVATKGKRAYLPLSTSAEILQGPATVQGSIEFAVQSIAGKRPGYAQLVRDRVLELLGSVERASTAPAHGGSIEI